MADTLSQLPNYTCHEVVNRLVRRAYSNQWNRMDTVELEVAFVGNKELLAHAGDSHFEEQPIRNVVPMGTIGNGAFGSHVASLFTGTGAEFKYVGTAKKEGHKTFHFEFSVPEDKSHFLVRHDSREGITGYQGSFWVDAATLDLVRLDVKADNIPAHIGVRLIEESIRYQTVRLTNSDFLLPRSSQLTAMDELGNYSLNMVSFERCKQYTGESEITYNTPSETGNTPADAGSANRAAPDRK
jgi:hypothetical protein